MSRSGGYSRTRPTSTRFFSAKRYFSCFRYDVKTLKVYRGVISSYAVFYPVAIRGVATPVISLQPATAKCQCPESLTAVDTFRARYSFQLSLKYFVYVLEKLLRFGHPKRNVGSTEVLHVVRALQILNHPSSTRASKCLNGTKNEDLARLNAERKREMRGKGSLLEFSLLHAGTLPTLYDRHTLARVNLICADRMAA